MIKLTILLNYLHLNHKIQSIRGELVDRKILMVAVAMPLVEFLALHTQQKSPNRQETAPPQHRNGIRAKLTAYEQNETSVFQCIRI